MRQVTWNENVIAADDHGDIGYWHPGLHPLRPLRWDERLPYPGDGRAEWRGLLPRGRTPHVINPEQGWLANWNNLPSAGWTNGDSEALERLAGPLHRVRILQALVAEVAERPQLRALDRDRRGGGHDRAAVPVRQPAAARARAPGWRRGRARATLATLLAWDGDYATTDAAGTVDPGVAIWEEFKDRLEAILLKPMGDAEAAADLGRRHRQLASVRHQQRRVAGPAQARRARLRPRRERDRGRARRPLRQRRPGRLARAAAHVRGLGTGRRLGARPAVLRPRNVEPVGRAGALGPTRSGSSPRA